MLQITPQMRIFVAVQPVDFRNGIDGLVRLCKEILRQDPFHGGVFVFRNRRATSVKVLVYDGQGFWLCQKRLSEGRFRWWPSATNDGRQDAGRPSTPRPAACGRPRGDQGRSRLAAAAPFGVKSPRQTRLALAERFRATSIPHKSLTEHGSCDADFARVEGRGMKPTAPEIVEMVPSEFEELLRRARRRGIRRRRLCEDRRCAQSLPLRAAIARQEEHLDRPITEAAVWGHDRKDGQRGWPRGTDASAQRRSSAQR